MAGDARRTSGRWAPPRSTCWPAARRTRSATTCSARLYRIVTRSRRGSRRARLARAVLAATMVKEPEQRWTAAQICAFLENGETDQTRLLPPLPAAPLIAPPPPPLPAYQSTPSPSPTRAPARRHPLLWPAAAALVVLTLVLGAWLLGRSGSGSPRDQARPPASSPGTTSATTGSPSTTASSTPSGPTADGMTGFVNDYLGTVTKDPKAAFTMLTPAFQQASGGYSTYHSWWAPIHGASLSNVRADPGAMTISYHVVYDSRTAGPPPTTSGSSSSTTRATTSSTASRSSVAASET